MSDQHPSTGHDSSAAATQAGAVATPEFDRQEISSFGQDDSHAVQVIGKMLVGFFFYSLIVMALVGLWTRNRGGQVETPDAAAAPHAEHAEDADE